MHSLIVISRNRPRFLARLLRYYAARGFPNPIRVGDASEPQGASEVRSVVRQHSSTLAVHVTSYDAATPPLERLKAEVNRVDSDFMAWVGDDDFLVPKALETADQCLTSRLDVAAVTGQALLLTVSNDKPNGSIIGLGKYPQIECLAVRATERLLAQAERGMPLTYSLRRTRTVVDILDAIHLLQLPDELIGYHMFEILDGLLTAVAGKVVLLPQIFMVRQAHRGSTGASGGDEAMRRILADPRWPEIKAQGGRVVARALEKRKLPPEAGEAANLAERAIELRCRRSEACLEGIPSTAALGTSLRHGARFVADRLPVLRKLRTKLYPYLAGLQRRDRQAFAEILTVIEHPGQPGAHTRHDLHGGRV